ncbi:MAG: undecaprenyldiphospho-muramoylpentapeptide beta-N-acetylglucosaminyltransferase [Buchnera aphidicola (Kaburagia rhusicola ensigallis)]
MRKKTIIIMAGGTCGHILPGLIIADELIKKGWDVFWIGTPNRIEAKIIPKNHIPIKFININAIKRNIFSMIKFFFQLLNSCYKTTTIIKQLKPNVILGMGGYISLPGGLMSIFFRMPLLIHEQNRVMGLSNKILSRFSTKIMQAFPETKPHAITVGNPLRKEIINLPNPTCRFKNRIGPLRILVIGGSQGAQILNSILPEIAYKLKKKIIIWHQVGTKNKQFTINHYKKFKLYPYKMTSFIENIAEAYNWADLTICRSGALTVSELKYIGLPAIFIPFPHKDKHQYWNAYPLQLQGGAIIVEQDLLSTNKIINILSEIDRDKITIMAKKLYSSSKINPVTKIIDIIESTMRMH